MYSAVIFPSEDHNAWIIFMNTSLFVETRVSWSPRPVLSKIAPAAGYVHSCHRPPACARLSTTRLASAAVATLTLTGTRCSLSVCSVPPLPSGWTRLACMTGAR